MGRYEGMEDLQVFRVEGQDDLVLLTDAILFGVAYAVDKCKAELDEGKVTGVITILEDDGCYARWVSIQDVGGLDTVIFTKEV